MSGTRHIGIVPCTAEYRATSSTVARGRTFNGPRFCRNPDFDLPSLAALIPVRPSATRALSATTVGVPSGFVDPALSLARDPSASAPSIAAARYVGPGLNRVGRDPIMLLLR